MQGDLAGGKVIAGAASRDPGNAGDADVLRAGLLMGKISTVVNSLGTVGHYAPSVIGLSTDALTGSGTTLATSAAIATEIVRRCGATGTLKLTGPPTASGTVRTLTATYSAVDTATGEVTITALGVADVWTLTAPAGQDAGMYRLEVTTGKGTAAESVKVTAALAANANTATVDAAVEALENVGVGGVAAVYADPTLTLTFASSLGPVHVRVLADTTNDGGVFEGGWAAVHTTTGVDGRFVTGSLIQPTDGSESILSIIPDGYGVKVTDIDGSTNLVTPFAPFPIAGVIEVGQVVNWPADASLKAWVMDQLNAYGKFVLDYGY